MVKAIIVEGPRGTGKSSVTRLLREQIEGSTLINLTGFKANGEEGLHKITQYYEAFMPVLENLSGDYTVIFDRHFFSEAVYSQLYKSYSFKTQYAYWMRRLVNAVDELEVFYLTITDAVELDRRLNNRFNPNKVRLFDSIPENVQETFKQQSVYDSVMNTFKTIYGERSDVTYVEIDTTDKTLEEIKDIILPF